MRFKKYKDILFDLDGTLTDPGVGITKSVQYALSGLGIYENDLTSLYKFIGPPLIDSFAKYYSLDEDTSQLAVARYREYFADQGKFENEVYPGIPEMLESLRMAGKRLYVATSKPTLYAVEILEHFELDSFFELIQGSNLDGTMAVKSEIISAVIEQSGMVNPRDSAMVGDRKFDIIGAIENGMDSVGVTYGYGTIEELEDAGALFLADSVETLLEIIN